MLCRYFLNMFQHELSKVHLSEKINIYICFVLAASKARKVVWVLSYLANVSLFIPTVMSPFYHLHWTNTMFRGRYGSNFFRTARIWLRCLAVLFSKGMLFFSMLMTSLFFHSCVLRGSTSGYSLCNSSVFPALPSLLPCKA